MRSASRAALGAFLSAAQEMREQGTFIFATDAVSYRNINATDSTNVHSVRSVSFSTAFFDLALGTQGDSTALTSYKPAY